MVLLLTTGETVSLLVLPRGNNLLMPDNGTFGARGGVVLKALRYKPAGRGFDSRWYHWNFSVT